MAGAGVGLGDGDDVGSVGGVAMEDDGVDLVIVDRVVELLVDEAALA